MPYSFLFSFLFYNLCGNAGQSTPRVPPPPPVNTPAPFPSSRLQTLTNTIIPAGFLSYSNKEFGIHIAYPADWKVRDNLEDNLDKIGLPHEVVKFVKDPGTSHATVEVMVDNNPRTNNLNNYLQGLIGTLNTAEAGHDIIYSSSSAIIADSPELKVKFDFSPVYISPALTFKNMLAITIIGDKAYLILYSAEPEFYSEELQNVQQMINSFAVSSPSLISGSS